MTVMIMPMIMTDDYAYDNDCDDYVNDNDCGDYVVMIMLMIMTVVIMS